jgi:DNA-binding response OmpR family regulator
VARLLVVEDEQDIRDLIAMRLMMVGHSVVAMPDAATALETVDRTGTPDAYLFDVGLPGMDGFRLLGQLRDGGDTTPAIFLSGRAERAQIGHGRSLGAQYLTKPFAAKALLSAVDQALAGVDPR